MLVSLTHVIGNARLFFCLQFPNPPMTDILNDISRACDDRNIEACLAACWTLVAAWKLAATLFSIEWEQSDKSTTNADHEKIIEKAWTPVRESMVQLKGTVLEAAIASDPIKSMEIHEMDVNTVLKGKMAGKDWSFSN